MNNRQLWKLMQEVIEGIVPRYEPAVKAVTLETGLDARTWGMLLAALSFEPRPVSVARLQVRGPYTAADAYLVRLLPAAEKGYLAEVAPGEYRLTEVGLTETQRSISVVREAMARADPLPLADGQRLVGLLRRVIGVSLAAPPPPDPWAIRLSFKLMPKTDPPLPYVEQAITCLMAYRDDAHLAAWRPSGLSAMALEALTFLWSGEAGSLEAVCERLAPRGHPEQVYAQALAELRQRDFVRGSDDALHVTDSGRGFRDQVEATTDRYFYGPWASLNDGDKIELGEILVRLRDGLRRGRP